MILDKSGSMSGLEKDVIGGFNSFIEKQKELEDEAILTTVLFDTGYEILHDNIDLKKVEPLTDKQYNVGGGTALLDALGRTINHIDHNHEENDKILFVINTDGEENSSVEFTKIQIKELVQHLEAEHGWNFIFLGADIDAFHEGAGMGVNNNFNFQKTGVGFAAMYSAVSDTTSTFRTTKGATLDVTQLSKLNDDTDTDNS